MMADQTNSQTTETKDKLAVEVQKQTATEVSDAERERIINATLSKMQFYLGRFETLTNDGHLLHDAATKRKHRKRLDPNSEAGQVANVIERYFHILSEYDFQGDRVKAVIDKIGDSEFVEKLTKIHTGKIEDREQRKAHKDFIERLNKKHNITDLNKTSLREHLKNVTIAKEASTVAPVSGLSGGSVPIAEVPTPIVPAPEAEAEPAQNQSTEELALSASKNAKRIEEIRATFGEPLPDIETMVMEGQPVAGRPVEKGDPISNASVASKTPQKTETPKALDSELNQPNGEDFVRSAQLLNSLLHPQGGGLDSAAVHQVQNALFGLTEEAA